MHDNWINLAGQMEMNLCIRARALNVCRLMLRAWGNPSLQYVRIKITSLWVSYKKRHYLDRMHEIAMATLMWRNPSR